MRLPALAILACVAPLAAQPRTEYRGFWVDTFNTSLNNHADIAAVVKNARDAHANQIYAQVRRRGDAWYLDSAEPRPDFVDIAPGFDPLQDLIVEAHANGVEVHAFVIMGAVWNKNPTFAPTATLGPPLDPGHVFNRHGGFDAATGTITPGPENWLTRTLLPDVAGTIGFQGHRFGSDFWLDFGHPGAAAYTVDVVMRLVRGYNIDGLHLDRIRYPDLSASGQTPSSGANIGYNAVNVARFQKHYARTAVPTPADPLWAQWRRDQVTNLVRRVYLNAIAVRPDLKVSAALIAYGGGPVAETDWRNAEAYWRVYQDWRAWLEEGILDVAIPMDYKRDHVAAEKTMFDQWSEWTKNHQYNRASMIGLGVYLNLIDGTLAQIGRSLAPSAAGRRALGVNLYAMANPASSGTFADFAAAVQSSVFADRALPPALPWKTAPRNGHLMGTGLGLDTVAVAIENLATHEVRTAVTDGGGFYGVVDLAPGDYFVRGVDAGVFYAGRARVEAGRVAVADLHAAGPRAKRPR
jgi:uncharacterized lipoprotein YddW (UPF0748 family)